MVGTLRRGTVAAAAAGLLLGTAACGDDGSGGDSGAIDWWHIQPANAPLTQVWNGLTEEFNEGSDVQVNVTPYENDAFKSALTTAIQGGDPPDMYQSWGGGVLDQQVEAGQVRDLTDDLADVIETIEPAALEPYTIDGRVYGLPWNMGMVGIWYNQDLFDEAGISEPPATWSDFLDVVEQLRAAGITPVALGGADLWPGHYWWSYLAMRVAGIEAFAQAHETQSFDDPGFVEAGRLLEEFVAMEPFQEGFLAAGFELADGEAQLMGNGEGAMELMGQWAPQAHVDNAGLEGEAAQSHLERLGFFPFPAVAGGAGAATENFGGGDGFAVGANAPDEIFDFIRLIFDNYDQIAADAGTIPTVAAAAEAVDDPNRRAVVDAVAAGTGFQLYLDQDYPPAVGGQVNESVGALFAGEMSPEEVVSTINEVWAREG